MAQCSVGDALIVSLKEWEPKVEHGPCVYLLLFLGHGLLTAHTAHHFVVLVGLERRTDHYDPATFHFAHVWFRWHVGIEAVLEREIVKVSDREALNLRWRIHTRDILVLKCLNIVNGQTESENYKSGWLR